jgi:hypothetical protein
VLQADGAARETARVGYQMAVTRIDARVIEARITHQGLPEGQVRYEVSRDGRTLTVSDGNRLMRIVFERASP